MNKTGLCVRFDCNNYGSMLQIFATQKAIEETGTEYEIIRYSKHALSSLIRQIPSIFNPAFMSNQKRLGNNRDSYNDHPDIKEKIQERRKIFCEYRNKYIGPYSPVYRGYLRLKSAAKSYDNVIVGSDQLWNPAGLESGFYNLLFVPDNVNKISFATSFGVSSISKAQQRATKHYLDRINHISVREQRGKEIVKSLTGRDALVALDPTLLYTGEEWKSFFPNSSLYDEPYIFAYLLGTNEEHRLWVRSLSNVTGLKVICCPHLDHFNECDLNFGDIQRFETSPIDFLNLIRNAKYVCTDSFHGTVFSILNHKQFLTFYRFSGDNKLSTNSRIDSLLGLLNLKDRTIVAGDADHILEKINNPINYQQVDKSLDVLRYETKQFISNAVQRR